MKEGATQGSVGGSDRLMLDIISACPGLDGCLYDSSSTVYHLSVVLGEDFLLYYKFCGGFC